MIDSNLLPGFNSKRLLSLIKKSITECNLQLNSLTVLTEAATGAYIVTPIIAAMAGAKKVYAIAKDTCYGSAEEVKENTIKLAEVVGVRDKIEFITTTTQDIVAQADIITNSGHVRPINAEMISWMNPNVTIALMYEGWEFRPQDIDRLACQKRDIPIVGVNERHPAVDVFSFLGIMAIKQLLDAGIAVYSCNILLLCDNPFRTFIERGLLNAGAKVDTVEHIGLASLDKTYDAIVVALQPQSYPVLSVEAAKLIANIWSEAVVLQYWGDIDRAAFSEHNIPLFPPKAPKSGHMGVLPSNVGPEAIVRLQTGGLTAAEVVYRQRLITSETIGLNNQANLQIITDKAAIAEILVDNCSEAIGQV
jgi:hypothetical protein